MAADQRVQDTFVERVGREEQLIDDTAMFYRIAINVKAVERIERPTRKISPRVWAVGRAAVSSRVSFRCGRPRTFRWRPSISRHGIRPAIPPSVKRRVEEFRHKRQEYVPLRPVPVLFGRCVFPGFPANAVCPLLLFHASIAISPLSSYPVSDKALESINGATQQLSSTPRIWGGRPSIRWCSL